MINIATDLDVTIKTETNVSALQTLNDAVRGKSLSYDAPFYCKEGMHPRDGVRLWLADKPEDGEDTEVCIMPTLSEDNKPVLAFYVHPWGDEPEEETADNLPAPVEQRPNTTDYVDAARHYIVNMNDKDLEAFGHDICNGKDQMFAALDTIDHLAAFNNYQAWDAYIQFMESNLSGMSFEIHDASQQ